MGSCCPTTSSEPHATSKAAHARHHRIQVWHLSLAGTTSTTNTHVHLQDKGKIHVIKYLFDEVFIVLLNYDTRLTRSSLKAGDDMLLQRDLITAAEIQ